MFSSELLARSPSSTEVRGLMTACATKCTACWAIRTAVDRHAGDRFGLSGRECGGASDVPGLKADVVETAEDDVVTMSVVPSIVGSDHPAQCGDEAGTSIVGGEVSRNVGQRRRRFADEFGPAGSVRVVQLLSGAGE